MVGAREPSARLAMLERLAGLIPTHTRRSEESQAFQQFSTPLALGMVARAAAALRPGDLVLEPSAGTGLLAVFSEREGASLVLNELAATRAGLLSALFPTTPVTRFDAAHIDDHIDTAIRPSVILMNPPFSVAAHVETRVTDAAYRHLASARSTSSRLSRHCRRGFRRLQRTRSPSNKSMRMKPLNTLCCVAVCQPWRVALISTRWVAGI